MQMKEGLPARLFAAIIEVPCPERCGPGPLPIDLRRMLTLEIATLRSLTLPTQFQDFDTVEGKLPTAIA